MGNCSGKKGAGSDLEEEIDFRGGNVHVITSKESWDQRILEANKDGKIVVANFSASWCGPCRMIAPLYKELSQKYPSLMFLTIDVDELMEFSSSWDIRATPTFLFLKDGQQLDKLIGVNRPELEKMIIQFVDSSIQCSKGSQIDEEKASYHNMVHAIFVTVEPLLDSDRQRRLAERHKKL